MQHFGRDEIKLNALAQAKQPAQLVVLVPKGREALRQPGDGIPLGPNRGQARATGLPFLRHLLHPEQGQQDGAANARGDLGGTVSWGKQQAGRQDQTQCEQHGVAARSGAMWLFDHLLL